MGGVDHATGPVQPGVRVEFGEQDPALAADGDEFSCSYFDLPVTKSTATHHFRVLRESGVIRQVYRGTAKIKGLRRDDLDGLFPGLVDAPVGAAARGVARLGVT
ncbi:helix-turn-helix domain-containing protein [Streptomyces sp. NBC_00481]|nr:MULTISPECIES: helix-turn-helix domain-containing protein [unclassified Streptomyces]WRZ00624.1 helix-turn-helix domain-containing protein [Streptomyces sp. NBC_00481]